jgi:hypothetical protein
LGYYDVSRRLAERLLALEPGDAEAVEALAKIQRDANPRGHEIMAPIRVLRFPGE